MARRYIRSNTVDEFVNYLEYEGSSSGMDDSEFDPVKLAVGVLVEVEHADDFDVAKEIAKDHLAEDDDYYGKYIFPDEAIERIEEEVEVEPCHDCWDDIPLEDFDPGFVDVSNLDFDQFDDSFDSLEFLDDFDLDQFEGSDIVVITLGSNWRQKLGQSLVNEVYDYGDHYRIGSGRLFSDIYFDVRDRHVRILPQSRDRLHLFSNYSDGLVPLSTFRQIVTGGHISQGFDNAVRVEISKALDKFSGNKVKGTANLIDGTSLDFEVSRDSPDNVQAQIEEVLDFNGYSIYDVDTFKWIYSAGRFRPQSPRQRQSYRIESARGAVIDPWRELVLDILQDVSVLTRVPKVPTQIKKQIYGSDHVVYWYTERLPDKTYACIEFHVDPETGWSEVYVMDDYSGLVWDSFVCEDLEDFSGAEIDRIYEAILNHPETELIHRA